MGLLEIVGPDLGAWYLCRNRKNWQGTSVAIVEPVNEMKIPGTATPGADGEPAGNMRIGASGKGRHFLVADMDPFEAFLSAQRIGDPVERIANYSIDSLDPRRCQSLHQNFRYRRHKLTPFPSVRLRPTGCCDVSTSRTAFIRLRGLTAGELR